MPGLSPYNHINREIKVNTSPKINSKATAILQQLSGLSLSNVLKLLRQVINQILKKVESGDAYQKPVFKMNKNFLPRGQKMKIELDPELQAFIHSITDPMTIRDIRDLCIEKFGAERVPSKSAIGRYLLKVRKQIEQEQSGNE